MYSLRQVSPNKQGARKNVKLGINNKNFSMGYLIIIVAFVIFIIRAINVVNNYNDPGGYAYVQMLNFSMPVVKTAVYDEGAYVENNLSLKNVALEAMGIRGINVFKIVGKEISLFSEMFAGSEIASSINKLTPFSLKKESIAKMTDEEIAELNKVSEAYDPSLKKSLDNSKIEVLIFHTHTTENYSERENLTTDTDFNVAGVGDVLAKELEEGYGISVIHDKTNHSVSYNESYTRSNETLNKYLNKYGDFKVIIDLHRDGVDGAKAEQLKSIYTMNINDQSLAKMMFVTAPNSSRYEANKAFVENLYNIGNRLFPGLIRDIHEINPAATAINYSLSDNFILIEDGANVNTAQEAKLTSKYIARIIAEHLNR
ncbi:MAG: stage II sporulation protein P [Clostridium sp.]|uniref:stage II sporulation protein P n=1 Tax=Clostridium sp. TaxID=1506 RepID=UPI002A91A3B7|nr:stage II sporulation protein P [Clostridium sp.]MDY6226625.1 stage II sporulation protein P [Clostridium sp.]